MTSPQILAQISGLQEMMRDLLRSVPEADANAVFHPKIASLGWFLGRSDFARPTGCEKSLPAT